MTRAIAAMLLAVSPSAVLALLLAVPALNVVLHDDAQHFVITTNVSVVALVVGLLVARAASQAKQVSTLLVALGFVAMAGLFTVHGLGTPNLLFTGARVAYAGAVLGVSAELALIVPAVLFALRYTGVAPFIARRIVPGRLVAAAVAAVALYAVFALAWPAAVRQIADVMLVTAGGVAGYDPASYGYGGYGPDVTGGAGFLPYAIVAATVLLYGYAALGALAEFRRSRLPLQGALGTSFVLLAQAQVSEFLGPTWTLSWWEYHALMLAAVALAVGAIVLELDRRRGLERFLPATLVERVIRGDARLAGERRVATILFADLRGSTALADGSEPERVVAVVNEYLGAFAESVLENGGVLDKFTGDGLMATFGTAGEAAAGARDAARAALAIRRRIAALNARRVADGEAVLGHGVGIHTGPAVLGAIGVPERSEYTALGDAVNVASRMETLTKELGVDVVLSSDAATLLDGIATRRLGAATVKGKAAPIEVHTLV